MYSFCAACSAACFSHVSWGDLNIWIVSNFKGALDDFLRPVRALYFFHFQTGGGRKRLPKFKFSAKFPIGLQVILQIQIKKFENDCYVRRGSTLILT